MRGNRDNLQLTREARVSRMNSGKELTGILIGRGMERGKGLVGLVYDVVEGGHCV